MEVYVVDNASTDASATAVEAEFPQVKIIRNKTRQGFSTNNNMVLKRGNGRYLMLLNDDTLVLNSALDRLVEFMDNHPQTGAVGSFLLNPDGSFQPAFARFPHPVIEALWPVMSWYHLSKKHTDRPFEVDSVHGAAMVIRRTVVEEVGVLDTDFDPIYSEEVDWCYRIRQAGWQIHALPEAKIVHYGSQTMNRIVPRKYELLLSHKLLFFRKHWGTGAANLYRLTLGFSTLIKLVYWTSHSLLPTDREAVRQRRHLHRYLLGRIPSL
jgi:hypothetical protein